MPYSRYCTLTLFLLIRLVSRSQQPADSVKPVFKTLDSVEVSKFINTSFIKPVSSTATKTSVQVIDIPQSISSITRPLIDDKMDFTLRDAVTDAANVNNYSGYDEYSIRGFLAENPRSINGLRGFNSTYSSLLLLNIESVDVLKGPAAVLYGNTDPGGTVNMITKKPLADTYGQVSLFGGSWDHFRAVGDFSGPANKSKSILYRLNAGYDQSNGFSDLYYSKAYQVAPSFTFAPYKDLSVNVDFSLSQVNTVLNRGQPGLEDDNNLFAAPSNLTVIQPGDYLKQMDLASMISIVWNINEELSFHTAYLNYLTSQNVAEHGLKSYIDYDSVNLYFQKWKFNTSTNSLTNYFSYKYTLGETMHEAVLGYDYISTDGKINQTHFENPGVFGTGSGIVGTFNLLHPVYNQMPSGSYQISNNHSGDLDAGDYYTQGIYLQDQITYKKWIMLLGIRREYISA